MAMEGLDYWRKYFGTSNSDIFGIIEHAIMIAASDCSTEFKLRRDGIAELLFSCQKTQCLGCKSTESGRSEFVEPVRVSEESKVISDVGKEKEMGMNQKVSNLSYRDAEALTDEIEEQSQFVGEVLRIREILYNSQDESDSTLYESLRKIQLMDLTVDMLKATQIGKAVNAIRKHGSKEVRDLAKTLIGVWKEMVDEWVNATAAIAAEGGTPDSVNPSVLDEEEGLPSPPLDEGAFYPTTQMELSRFFDGMDDDGNLNNPEAGRKPMATKPSKSESGPGRPPRVNVDQRITNVTKNVQKSDNKVTIQSRPLNFQKDKLKPSDEVSTQMKLEATKRKLQENYQQFENAKKQRTIQVMELSALPKRGLGIKNPHAKLGNHNRTRAFRRN